MRILLARSGGLGDCILTLHVARFIQHACPGVELHVLGNATMLAVARISGAFTEYRSIDDREFSALYSCSAPSCFLYLFFSRFDNVFFYSAGESELLRHTILESGAGACHILDPRPPAVNHGHILNHLLSILNGMENRNTFSLDLTEFKRTLLRENTVRGNKLIVHPGSGSPLKNWPVERYISVAETSELPAAFVLGPAEIEHGLVQHIPEDRFEIVCPENINELYNLFDGAGIYIGNDSGASHLAAWRGTPSLVLFGPTDPAVWSPIGINVTVLSSTDGTMEGISIHEVNKILDTMIINE